MPHPLIRFFSRSLTGTGFKDFEEFREMCGELVNSNQQAVEKDSMYSEKTTEQA